MLPSLGSLPPLSTADRTPVFHIPGDLDCKRPLHTLPLVSPANWPYECIVRFPSFTEVDEVCTNKLVPIHQAETPHEKAVPLSLSLQESRTCLADTIMVGTRPTCMERNAQPGAAAYAARSRFKVVHPRSGGGDRPDQTSYVIERGEPCFDLVNNNIIDGRSNVEGRTNASAPMSSFA